MRFGVTAPDHGRARVDGIGYALFLPIGLDSSYAAAILPTILLAGFGFALAYGPLNIAATNGVAPHEQGLASGLVNTSFQFGGALVLAVATAVNNANVGTDGSQQAVLDGFQAAVIVSVIAALLGVLVTSLRLRPLLVEAPAAANEPDVVESEPEARAA